MGMYSVSKHRHKLPAVANRLRINRGFDSAWYSDCSYAQMLQKDWLLSKTVWSFVSRSSRSLPRMGWKEEQLKAQQAAAAAAAAASGTAAGTAGEAGKAGSKGAAAGSKGAAAVAPVPKGHPVAAGAEVKDFPNFRPARIFMQHLPYKSIASVFAYSIPKEGPQAKYGLFQPRRVFEPRQPQQRRE